MYSLILGGLFLIIAEIFKPKKHKIFKIYDINFIQSIIIGCVQALSLYPGCSRSGVTIATGVLLGFTRKVAIEFSFISSVPLLMGASFFEIFNNTKNLEILNFSTLFIGFFMSLLISIFFINKILNVTEKISLIWFGFYRFLISGLIYFKLLN